MAYSTWTETPYSDYQIDAFMPATLKELQRITSGRKDLHPEIMRLIGLAWASSPNVPIFGTAPEIAEAVARFLPSK